MNIQPATEGDCASGEMDTLEFIDKHFPYDQGAIKDTDQRRSSSRKTGQLN